MKLLSPQSSNAKLSKNSSITGDWETSILYLAPASTNSFGINLCPGSTAGCRASCLNTAGRGAMNSVQVARLKKSDRFISNRKTFLAELVADLEYLVRKQKRTGIKQAVRLNGTSDIQWERQPVIRSDRQYPGIPQAFPELQFYDYTKIFTRLRAVESIANYVLTFSASEVTSDRLIKAVNKMQVNTAIVFNSLPTEYLGIPVIDGTTHDMRFIDWPGKIVGLLPKGKAKKDTSGFVRNHKKGDIYE